MSRQLCVHDLADLTPAMVPDFRIAARTTSVEELQQALTAVEPSALVLDLDVADALRLVALARELRPEVCIVGVSGSSKAQDMIAAQRAGCNQVTPKPLDPADLDVALRRGMREAAGESEHGKVVSFMGAGGGAGATTLVCHVAAEMAQQTGQQVGVFDLNLQFGGVARAFDLTPRFTVADLAAAGTMDALLLERAAVTAMAGVRIFGCPATIPESHTVDEHAVRAMLRIAGQCFSHVIVDLPQQLNALTGAALECSDMLVIVTQLTVPHLWNARRIIDALGAENFASERIAVVVNRYRKNLNGCTLEQVEHELQRAPLAVVPSDYHAVHRALDVGRPLANGSAVRAALRDLAHRLSGETKSPQRGGWLTRLGLGR